MSERSNPQSSRSGVRETYTVSGLICDNCRHKPRWPGKELAIPKGQAVKDTACPKCGCKTLRRGF